MLSIQPFRLPLRGKCRLPAVILSSVSRRLACFGWRLQVKLVASGRLYARSFAKHARCIYPGETLAQCREIDNAPAMSLQAKMKFEQFCGARFATILHVLGKPLPFHLLLGYIGGLAQRPEHAPVLDFLPRPRQELPLLQPTTLDKSRSGLRLFTADGPVM